MSFQFALDCFNVQCFISQLGWQIVPQCSDQKRQNSGLQKPTLLIRGAFSLPWAADRLRRSDSTAATGVVISQRYEEQFHADIWIRMCRFWIQFVGWWEASVEHLAYRQRLIQISSFPSPSVQLSTTRTGESPAVLPPHHIECCCNSPSYLRQRRGPEFCKPPWIMIFWRFSAVAADRMTRRILVLCELSCSTVGRISLRDCSLLCLLEPSWSRCWWHWLAFCSVAGLSRSKWIVFFPNSILTGLTTSNNRSLL